MPGIHALAVTGLLQLIFLCRWISPEEAGAMRSTPKLICLKDTLCLMGGVAASQSSPRSLSLYSASLYSTAWYVTDVMMQLLVRTHCLFLFILTSEARATHH